jgi:hypothetical protein
MKKLFTLSLLIFVILVSKVNSQTFTFYRVSPAIVYGDTSSTSVTPTKGIFKNTGTTSLSFKIVRVLNNLPGPTWSSQMCVGVNCYAPTVDSVPPRGMSPMILTAGQQDTLLIDLVGQSIGTAVIAIQCYVNNNPAVSIVDTFRVALGPVGITKISSEVDGYSLKQNYPNPFNPSTVISFSIPKKDNVSLVLYDILGNQVANLINNESIAPGKYNYEFNASEFNLSTGTYYYKITTSAYSAVKKMILIK